MAEVQSFELGPIPKEIECTHVPNDEIRFHFENDEEMQIAKEILESNEHVSFDLSGNAFDQYGKYLGYIGKPVLFK